MVEVRRGFVEGRGTGSGARNRMACPTCRGRNSSEIPKACCRVRVAVRFTPVVKVTKGLRLGGPRTMQNRVGRQVRRSSSAHLAI